MSLAKLSQDDSRLENDFQVAFRCERQLKIGVSAIPGGECGVLTRHRVISPPLKMTTMCHLILMTPCVISSFGPDLTRSDKSSLLPEVSKCGEEEKKRERERE